MSWTIHNILNTVKVSDACSKELNNFYLENMTDYNISGCGVIWFFSDDMEFMDYIGHYKEIQEILCKHRVIGQIGFADFEGDNKGKIWGYNFDGTGNMHKMTGKINWENKD